MAGYKEEINKTVLITGCTAPGIGNALAREFHAQGCKVIASARDRAAIADLEELGMTTLDLDVTSEESIVAARKSVEKIIGEMGGGIGLDVLVNNAGRNMTLPALDVPLAEARATFEANFFSVVLMNQVFSPLLIQAKGLILNIGSVAGIIPYVYSSIYNASKAALHAYSDTLRLELEPFGVRVLVAVTGGVKSNIARTERTLPEGTLYKEIEPEFNNRVKHSQQGAMDATTYAKGVVAEALKKSPMKWYWRGNMAHAIKWAWRFGLGSWVFGRYMRRIGGLTRLKAVVEGVVRLGKKN